MYRPDEFLKYSAEYLDKQVKEEFVSEVKTVQDMSTSNDEYVKSYRLGYHEEDIERTLFELHMYLRDLEKGFEHRTKNKLQFELSKSIKSINVSIDRVRHLSLRKDFPSSWLFELRKILERLDYLKDAFDLRDVRHYPELDRINSFRHRIMKYLGFYDSIYSSDDEYISV